MSLAKKCTIRKAMTGLGEMLCPGHGRTTNRRLRQSTVTRCSAPTRTSKIRHSSSLSPQLPSTRIHRLLIYTLTHTKHPRESTARSAPKLSYREHERVRDMPPQLPPLDFIQTETDSQRGAHPPTNSYGGNMSEGRNLPAGTTATTFETRNPLSYSHEPSIQAELPAERSPTDEPNKGIRDDGVVCPTTSHTRMQLHPGTHATTPRLSTDFTWQPGAQQGGYI